MSSLSLGPFEKFPRISALTGAFWADRGLASRQGALPRSWIICCIQPHTDLLTPAKICQGICEGVFPVAQTPNPPTPPFGKLGGSPISRIGFGEKREIKEGRIPPERATKPAKLRQKDRDARWTVKYTKAKPNEESMPRVDLAVAAFGYKNHVGIDRRRRLIRRWSVTDAARHDGSMLAELIDKNNTASDVTTPFVKGWVCRESEKIK
jgi:Asp-tRNA(Asn)/Glu-tRNA(Gln) amidotransferase A subunit family amidase